VTGLLQLAGLVAVAFFVSSALERNRRGLGLAGLYVLAGVLLGPFGTSVLDDQFVPFLTPIISLCVTWLAFLFGVQLHGGSFRRVGIRGGVGTLLQAGLVTIFVTVGLLWLPLSVPAIAAAGIGLISATSSRTTLRRARSRFGAAGPLTSFLDRITALDDLIPLLGLMVLAAWFPSDRTPAALRAHPLFLVACELGLGAAIGALFPLAAGASANLDRAWLVLLGMLFLGAGAAERLGVPEMAVGLIAGIVVCRTGGVRVLQRVVASTKRPVTLLLLVLVGSRLAPSNATVVVALSALGLRLLGKMAVGPLLGVLGAGGLDAGLGLLGYGGLALAGAAQVDLLYRGAVGPLVLLAAAADGVAGDVLGPLGIRLVLGRRREIGATVSADAAASSSAPDPLPSTSSTR
jgi:hypothetical protein